MEIFRKQGVKFDGDSEDFYWFMFLFYVEIWLPIMLIIYVGFVVL